ncbi:DUF4168 domain-containing protein [Leptolyngbya subtilissima ST-M1]|uniref:DUF4168 domain-containing protein n=1 Tax=Cyanophyceae TaxID=3028117 RepID=UPI0018EFF4D7
MKRVLSRRSMGFEWMTAAVEPCVRCLKQRGKTGRQSQCLMQRVVYVGAVILLLLGMGTPALAVSSLPMADVPAPAVSPTQPDANDIPSETVSRFVNAYMAVVKLIESRELGLQRAETDTESRQMQQEIQAAALDLIQANGLTLSAYWELLGLANSDPEFRDRVLAQIDEANL